MKLLDAQVKLLYEKTVLELAFDNQDRSQIVEMIGKSLRKGAEYEVIIQPKRNRRSLDANAYMWALADRIAEAIHATKEEVYRHAIRAVGVFTDVAVQKAACDELVDDWHRNGIGWFAEVFDSGLRDAAGGGMMRVRLYKGSHLYDSRQMARLIDWMVEEAKSVGVEYLPQADVERMIKAMDGGQSGQEKELRAVHENN